MSVLERLKKRSLVILLFSLFLCIFAFQNCAQTDLENQDLSSESDDSSHSQYTSDSVPFAYKISADHIALMTCPTSNQRGTGYFTYKWGAYRNGLVFRPKDGLGLSEDFLAEYGSHVNAKKFDILSSSPKNSNLNIVSALYDQGNYSLALVFDNFQTGLMNTTSSYSVNNYLQDVILASGDGANYFSNIPVGSSSARNLEASLYRQSVSGYSSPLNDEFSYVLEQRMKNKELAIGFAHKEKLSGGYPLINEDGSYIPQKAAGTGYTLSYGRVGSFDRYLTNIFERPLSGEASGQAQWQCAANMRFKIVQRGDLNETNCNPRPISASLLNANTTQGQRFRSIANIIDLSQWEVDVDNYCVVRKNRALNDPCYNSSYYGYQVNGVKQTNITDIQVDYSETRCVNDPIENFSGGGTTAARYYICPHYISICIKSF